MSQQIHNAINRYVKSINTLKKLGVLYNKKDFTSQLGEWLVESIYEGKRASNPTQKGWDVIAGDKYFQVKSHAKADGNNNRWSHLDVYDNIKVDALIIVVFTENYKLKEFYHVPWEFVLTKIKIRGIKRPKSEITWDSLKEFKMDFTKLPNQQTIKIFLK